MKKQTITKTVNLDIVSPDVNGYMLLGLFKGQARKELWTEYEINTVVEEAKNGDYDHLVTTIKSYCKPVYN